MSAARPAFPLHGSINTKLPADDRFFALLFLAVSVALQLHTESSKKKKAKALNPKLL